MNCATAREQLFRAEHASKVAPAVATHLLGCLECRAAQWRLERLERDLPRLRVPACPPPAALLEKVLQGSPDGTLVRVPAGSSCAPDRRQGARQKLALTFALAASLAVFALGWGLWSGRQTPVGSAVRQEYKQRLAENVQPGGPPRLQVEQLTAMAEKMLDEAKEASAAKLGGLAKQFEWLTKDDLPRAAKRLPAGELAAVLEVTADRLQKLESAAAKLEAAALTRRAESEAAQLGLISASLRDANRRMRQMAEATG